MVWIRDVVDQLVEYCFNDELKRLLEPTIGGHVLSVKSQFLYHYRHACYRGSLDELKEAILYQIHNNYDRIIKLNDFYTNMDKLVDLKDYTNVKINYDAELATEGKIYTDVSNTNSIGKHVSNSSNINKDINSSLNTNSSAGSRTNELYPIKEVIKPPQQIEQQLEQSTYTIQGNTIQESKDNVTYQSLNKIGSTDNPVAYQDFTTNQSVDQSNNTTKSNTSTANDSLNKSNITRVGSRTKGSKTDATKHQVKYTNNEARIKAWTTELPRLKQDFWKIFYYLFRYEHL